MTMVLIVVTLNGWNVAYLYLLDTLYMLVHPRTLVPSRNPGKAAEVIYGASLNTGDHPPNHFSTSDLQPIMKFRALSHRTSCKSGRN